MVPRVKLLTELVGTFLFLTVISLSGAAGPLQPLAIGGALVAVVYMGGHLSGAHYNPAVTFGLFLRGKIGLVDGLLYWVAQLVGAALAFTFGYLVSGHSGGIHPGKGVAIPSAVAVEAVFAAMLVLVILNVAATRATQGNSFYGLAIGITVMAAVFVGGPISGGAYNPAIGFGATFGSAVFAGGSWSDLWIYLVGPLLGGAFGAGVHRLQVGADPG
jgi:aquaporin Z